MLVAPLGYIPLNGRLMTIHSNQQVGLMSAKRFRTHIGTRCGWGMQRRRRGVSDAR